MSGASVYAFIPDHFSRVERLQKTWRIVWCRFPQLFLNVSAHREPLLTTSIHGPSICMVGYSCFSRCLPQWHFKPKVFARNRLLERDRSMSSACGGWFLLTPVNYLLSPPRDKAIKRYSPQAAVRLGDTGRGTDRWLVSTAGSGRRERGDDRMEIRRRRRGCTLAVDDAFSTV